MNVYIVRTNGGYLYPFANGVSLTSDPAQAGHFLSTEEAREMAVVRGYHEEQFEILPVDVDTSHLNRNWND